MGLLRELWSIIVREHRLVVWCSATLHAVNCYALELILHLAIVLSRGYNVVEVDPVDGDSGTCSILGGHFAISLGRLHEVAHRCLVVVRLGVLALIALRRLDLSDLRQVHELGRHGLRLLRRIVVAYEGRFFQLALLLSVVGSSEVILCLVVSLILNVDRI